jgi:hypothetical protein
MLSAISLPKPSRNATILQGERLRATRVNKIDGVLGHSLVSPHQTAVNDSNLDFYSVYLR